MTKLELLTQARTFLDDSETPYLWGDAELTAYLQDAEAEAAFRANLLETTGVADYCQINLAADTMSYTLNGLVYEVVRARVAGESDYLERTSREKLDRTTPTWEDDEGIPKKYYVHESTLIVTPTPTETATLKMVVRRLPVSPIGDSPEVHGRHHMRLLDWVYRQAYRKQDADTYDLSKSKFFELMFDRSFGPRLDARLQIQRQRKTPTKMKDSEYGERW